MAGVGRPKLIARSSSAASVGDEDRRARPSGWEEQESGAGPAVDDAQQQNYHHQYKYQQHHYDQPGKGQTEGLSREMRHLLEGRKGSRGLWPSFILLFVSALLIVSEVYIRSGPAARRGLTSPSGLLQDSALVEPWESRRADPIAAEQIEWRSRDKSLADAVAALAQRASSLQTANAELEKALTEMNRERMQRAAEEVTLLTQFKHQLSAIQQAASQQCQERGSLSTSGLQLQEMLEQLQSRVRSHVARRGVAALQQEEKESEEEKEEDGGGGTGRHAAPGASHGQASFQGTAFLQQEQDGADTDTASGVDSESGMGAGGRLGVGVRSSTVDKEQLVASWEAWLRKERNTVEDPGALSSSPAEDDSSSNTGEAWRPGSDPWGVPPLAPVPLHPPHFEDCVATAKMVKVWDERKEDGSMPYWSPLGARTELATRQALLRAAKALAAKAEAKKKRKGKLWASVQESLDLLADTQAEWQALENQAEMTHQRAPRVRSRQALEIHHTTQEADGSQHSEAWWQALGNRREGLPEGAEGSEGAQGAIEAWHLEVERQAHANRGESHFESDEGAKGAHDEAEVEVQENVRFPGGGSRVKPGAVFPPWVRGADDDLLVLTRAVQHDLWQLQHPRDCSLPSTKFLVVNASQQYSQYMGVGAQVAWLTGALAEAVNEGRVMVITIYERADHDACKGDQRGRWACYFAPETSEQCRMEALRLARDPAAVRSRRVTFSSNKTPRPTRFFFYDVPRLWGHPWKLLHRTVEVGGVLTGRTHTDSRRWWFAQATRYLMRYPSPRLCSLLNGARHHAFGGHVADLVMAHGPTVEQEMASGSREEGGSETEQGMPVRGIPVQLRPGVGLAGVWAATRRAYVPHGLISVHVRQGDKDKEMRLYGFGAYMSLASRIRAQFPYASSVWLSTEMASVVREAETKYPHWSFHYTEFPRQTEKNVSMREYERQLGMQRTSDNAFVNLLMAADAEFFVGALGSTWSILIDNLRVTSGKVASGFVSVNGDRYWYAKRTAGDDGPVEHSRPGF